MTLHLQDVVTELQRADTDLLTAPQRSRRVDLIAVLDGYVEAGQFPHNHTVPHQRTPVFVDRHGTHCAVGYLLAASGRPDLVSAAVATDNQGWLQDLATPELADWATEVGLTVDELARIQPSYSFRQPERPDPALEMERLLASMDSCEPMWQPNVVAQTNARPGPRARRCLLEQGSGQRNSVEMLTMLVLRQRAAKPEEPDAAACAALLRSVKGRFPEVSGAGVSTELLADYCGTSVPAPPPSQPPPALLVEEPGS